MSKKTTEFKSPVIFLKTTKRLTLSTPLIYTIFIGLFTCLSTSTADTPLQGQIIVAPQNNAWLMYKGGGPFFMAGPGDPEDFLYRGKLKHDGTRNGDQLQLIEKLKATGANSIYLQAIRSHGGDGNLTHNPFVNNDPRRGLNHAVLNQWEQWFKAMDDHGIVIFFFLYDDSARIWNTGDTVSPEEYHFIETLINRFEHHKHLIWVVAEEYAERYTPARITNIAKVIRALDDYDHVIAVHKNSGLDFREFADDQNIDQFAIQYNAKNPRDLHDGMVKAWNDAAGRYNLNMSEFVFGDIRKGNTARKNIWAIAMGGAYVMIYGMDIVNTPIRDLVDLGRLKQFMEATNLIDMVPHDELANGATEYVLAHPGSSYIVYSSDASGDKLGLKDMQAGRYQFHWLDIVNGSTKKWGNIDLVAGINTWQKPNSFSNEVVVYIKRVQ